MKETAFHTLMNFGHGFVFAYAQPCRHLCGQIVCGDAIAENFYQRVFRGGRRQYDRSHPQPSLEAPAPLSQGRGPHKWDFANCPSFVTYMSNDNDRKIGVPQSDAFGTSLPTYI